MPTYTLPGRAFFFTAQSSLPSPNKSAEKIHEDVSLVPTCGRPHNYAQSPTVFHCATLTFERLQLGLTKKLYFLYQTSAPFL